MQLIINQQPCEFVSDTLDVPTLLANRGVREEAIAVAVNGEVVPRRKWSTVTLADGDRVELVKVVAGGDWDDDPLLIGGKSFTSRLLLGTTSAWKPWRYRSPLLKIQPA